ncbi:hypothetical protein GN958_ATG17469, partial [Phytophthora infestans]
CAKSPAAGEATEALAAKYGAHRVALWHWAKGEGRIKDAQGVNRKKMKMRKVKRGAKLRFSGLESRHYNIEMVGLLSGINGSSKYESVFSMDQTCGNRVFVDLGFCYWIG